MVFTAGFKKATKTSGSEEKITLALPEFRVPRISFPPLEQVAKDFADNNGLKLVEITSFDVRRPNFGNESSIAKYTGKILQLEHGLAVLVCAYENHGPGNLEPTLGGGPVESYKMDYILSGKLNDKNVNLCANISYSRGCEQEVKSCELPPYTKYLKWVPNGEFRKTIYRLDREKLWFLVAQNK